MATKLYKVKLSLTEAQHDMFNDFFLKLTREAKTSKERKERTSFLNKFNKGHWLEGPVVKRAKFVRPAPYFPSETLLRSF